MTGPRSDLHNLRDATRTFARERDWGRFHDPKSLLLALVGEVGELAELFQWLPSEQAAALAQEKPLAGDVRDELADILLYLVGLADVLDVDLFDAAQAKLIKNARKHPAPQDGA